ncbi:MAG: hypothetical protein JWO38_753 [Gemmataceae bacterium]|nr:hypothetical protein [Gemmataceae bacterium]
MRLHHTTDRKLCSSIAERGFRDSYRMATGVYLSPPDQLWVGGGFSELDFDLLEPYHVVFAFDVPDDIAAQYAVREKTPTRDDVDVPENLDDDPPENWDTSGPGWLIYEYCIPAAVANLFCVGPVHWTGDPPLTEAQLTVIAARLKPATDPASNGEPTRHGAVPGGVGQLPPQRNDEMTEVRRQAYEDGRMAANRFAALHPDEVKGFPRGTTHLFTPEGGAILRVAMDNVERTDRLQQQHGNQELPPVCSALLSDLMERYGRLKEHIAAHPESTDSDPKMAALVSSIEAIGDAARSEALRAGVPGADLCVDEPKPEDEYFARGFVEQLDAALEWS